MRVHKKSLLITIAIVIVSLLPSTPVLVVIVCNWLYSSSPTVSPHLPSRIQIGIVYLHVALFLVQDHTGIILINITTSWAARGKWSSMRTDSIRITCNRIIILWPQFLLRTWNIIQLHINFRNRWPSPGGHRVRMAIPCSVVLSPVSKDWELGLGIG